MAKDDDDTRVGYGKPPRHSRFKAGVSGNPSGRKKGVRSLKCDFEDELSQPITVTENGKTLTLTKQRLVVKALTAKAAKGDVKAIGRVIDLIRDIFGLGGGELEADRDEVPADEAAMIDAYLARRAAAPPEHGDG